MEELELGNIEKQIFDLLYDGLSISEFEQWVYNTSELQLIITPEDYLSLISLDYKSKHARAEIEKILDKYINYGKFETIRVINLLNKALNKDKNIGEILRQFYDMYCNGYCFFEDLGLGYGLACEVPLKYANSWEKLSDEQKTDIITGFYPQIESDIKRAIDWIESKKILLTGLQDDMNRWQFIDNRTSCEKKSTVWMEAENKTGVSVKRRKLDTNKKGK